MAVIFSFSGAAKANERHSACSFRRATIAYRWHPLFGRMLQVSRKASVTQFEKDPA